VICDGATSVAMWPRRLRRGSRCSTQATLPRGATRDDEESSWRRYAWLGGIVFVIALESVVATGVGLTQDDSALGIVSRLH
jgi:hypothetical protein